MALLFGLLSLQVQFNLVHLQLVEELERIACGFWRAGKAMQQRQGLCADWQSTCDGCRAFLDPLFRSLTQRYRHGSFYL
jgi:hypothetical protein